MQTEDRFFEAASVINSRTGEDDIPDCVLRIDRTSALEDMDGVDAVIYTTTCEIPVQIKSSLYGAQQFNRTHPDFVGILIVIREEAEIQDIIDGIIGGVLKFIESSEE